MSKILEDFFVPNAENVVSFFSEKSVTDYILLDVLREVVGVSINFYTDLVVRDINIYEIKGFVVLDRLFVYIIDSLLIEYLHSHFLVSGDIRLFPCELSYSIRVGFSLSLSFLSIRFFFWVSVGTGSLVVLYRVEVVKFSYLVRIAKICLDRSWSGMSQSWYLRLTSDSSRNCIIFYTVGYFVKFWRSTYSHSMVIRGFEVKSVFG